MRKSKHEWLEVFQNLAEKRQGLCISAAYINQRTKLDFTCSCNGSLRQALVAESRRKRLQ